MGNLPFRFSLTFSTRQTLIRGLLDVPLPMHPYWKSLYKPDIAGIFDPQESLENPQ